MKKAKDTFTQSTQEKTFYRVVIPGLAIVSAVILYLLIQQYTASFRTAFATETKGYMLEIAQQVTLVMNDRVAVNLKNIETDAVALARMKLDEIDEQVAFLNEEAMRYGYSKLLLAGTDGTAITNAGEVIHVSTRKHFLSALQGKAAVSGLVNLNYRSKDAIEFAVPVKDGGVVIGVLIASYSLEDFQDILQVNMFDGHGSTTVIDQRGVVIVSNGEQKSYNLKHALKGNESMTAETFAQFSQDIVYGQSGSFEYVAEGSPVMVYYQPLGINDWTLLVSAPTDQITSKTKLFLQGTAYVSMAIAALVTFLMLLVVITQMRHRKTLEQLLYIDPVTDGISYAKFEMEAKKRIAEKPQGHYVLLQLNIEKFKLINTTYGREAGNRLLRYFYNTLDESLGSDELLTRVSADRFCLLLQYHSQADITQRLLHFNESVNSFNEGKAMKYLLHFNAGARIVDTDMPDIAMLYEQANFSRSHGEGVKSESKIAFYDELERDILLREKEIENQMDEALKRHEFEAYLQPKYELSGNTIAGAEALARWNDPLRGLVSPGEFIPLFERNGFIIKLDLFMFEQVCKIQQRLWENGEHCVPISVNLSRKHLEHLDFMRKYQEIFERYTFPANLLEIELTESIVFDNVEQLRRVIDEIHQIGFECSMDDFGSGYSSLNMLKDIPVDTLKLDRAFFYSNSGDNDKSRYVVENVINLATKLQMKTVSEGIETIEQVEYLRGVNCGMVQGYVFAKPMAVAEFEILLKKGK